MSDVDRIAVVVVTHRGVSDETRESLKKLACPSVVEVKGLANLPRARSLAIDQALDAVRGTKIDALLLVDDDMVFHPDGALGLVDVARERDAPVSGFCLRRDGSVSARPWPPGSQGVGRWLTGLAFMAAPVAALERMGETLPRLGGIRVWCQTGAHDALPGEWVPEDFWFCLHWDGVELAPFPAGHVKPVPIWPDARSMRLVLEGGASSPRE